MRSITAELYKRETGSTMSVVQYVGHCCVEEIAEDLRHDYDNWDYAQLTDSDGNLLATIWREE